MFNEVWLALCPMRFNTMPEKFHYEEDFSDSQIIFSFCCVIPLILAI